MERRSLNILNKEASTIISYQKLYSGMFWDNCHNSPSYIMMSLNNDDSPLNLSLYLTLCNFPKLVSASLLCSVVLHAILRYIIAHVLLSPSFHVYVFNSMIVKWVAVYCSLVRSYPYPFYHCFSRSFVRPPSCYIFHLHYATY